MQDKILCQLNKNEPKTSAKDKSETDDICSARQKSYVNSEKTNHEIPLKLIGVNDDILYIKHEAVTTQ